MMSSGDKTWRCSIDNELDDNLCGLRKCLFELGHPSELNLMVVLTVLDQGLCPNGISISSLLGTSTGSTKLISHALLIGAAP